MEKNIRIFMVIVLGLSIYSCKTFNYGEIESVLPIGFDIIENPDKIKDIKNNYPAMYDERYLDNRMKDTSYIRKLIDFIQYEFRFSGAFINAKYIEVLGSDLSEIDTSKLPESELKYMNYIHKQQEKRLKIIKEHTNLDDIKVSDVREYILIKRNYVKPSPGVRFIFYKDRITGKYYINYVSNVYLH